MLDRDRDIRKPNLNQRMGMRLIQEAMRFMEDSLDLDPVEVAALVGRELGEYCGCHDDAMTHDDDWMRRMKEAAKREGRQETLQPTLGTANANIEFAYEDHIVLHNKIREGKEIGKDLLNKVCESHKKM